MSFEVQPPERWHPSMPKSTAFGLWPLIKAGFDIEVGAYSYGIPAVRWLAEQAKLYKLSIGKYCSFAAEIDIYVGRLGRHPTEFLSTYPIGMVHGPLPRGDKSRSHEGDLSVHIGSDVWVARGVQIMAGVTIGHGAIVGAKAVVTKSIPPYGIAIGAPAQLLRYRFDERIIERLLKLRWWDLPPETLTKNNHIFNRTDIELVLEDLDAIQSGLLTAPSV